MRQARKGYLVDALPEKVECQSENSGFCTLIENSIRPAAVIRENLQCLQTIKSAESVFDILSVYRTLQLNKVEDPQEFLRRYCRSLYLYMVENAWTAALKDGKDPAKKIKSYDFKELRKGFDFSSWLPWKANLTKK